MRTETRVNPSIEPNRSTTRLGVVVPTKSSDRTLEACLRSARQQTVPIDLIVVDNSSDDATVEIARRIADRVETLGPERSAQRNYGARISDAEFVLFLDSDLLLDPDVAADAIRAFDSDPDLGALVIPESAFGEGFWARCRVLEKLIYQGDRSVEAARIFRRDVFEEVGGYDETLTGSEDWELPDRVVAAGWKVGRIGSGVSHDEGRLRLGETFRKKQYYGRSFPAYLHKAGRTGVRRLFRVGLFRRPALLVRHPIRAVGLMVLKAVEASGLLVGMVRSLRAG